MSQIGEKCKLLIKGTTNINSCNISLPTSKSISNRVLIINSFLSKPKNIYRLSDSDDSVLMQSLLEKISLNKHSKNIIELNCNNAGTVFRFLTGKLSITDGKWLLTGSKRMKQRPIEPMIRALIQLGAEIEFAENNLHPPVLIYGKNNLIGHYAEIDGTISSQFISALLMIAPLLRNGLTLRLKNKLVSMPYVMMTLNIMKYFGINYSFEESIINISPQKYLPKEICIETDWSSASYWYSAVSLAENTEIKLNELYLNSIQGDSIIANWYTSLGVSTTVIPDGIVLKNKAHTTNALEYDFINHPDIAISIAVVLASKGIKGTLKGLKNLDMKESNRLQLLYKELYKNGYDVEIENNDILLINHSERNFTQSNTLHFDSHNDHRFAMAFSLFALNNKDVILDNPYVTQKSYPDFFKDLQKAGITISEISNP